MRPIGGVIDGLARIGDAAAEAGWRSIEALAFFGEVVAAFARWLLRRERLPAGRFVEELERSGPRVVAIPVLVGLLLGVVGAVGLIGPLAEARSLSMLPGIVADLALREGGPFLAALFLAAQVAPSFAAELAANPERAGRIEEQVLPRLLATSLTAPLLVIYVQAAMLLGSELGGSNGSQLGWEEYLERTLLEVTPRTLAVAAAKGFAFGLAIAFSGCAAGQAGAVARRGIGGSARRAFATSVVWILLIEAAFVGGARMVEG